MSKLEDCTALQNRELCGCCELRGWCRHITYEIITPGQITRELLLVGRQTVCELVAEHDIAAPKIPDFLVSRSYRLLGRWVHPYTREECDPNHELLWYDKVKTDKGFKLDVGSPSSLRNWYRYQYVIPYQGTGLPYLPPRKSLRRHAVILSLVRAAFTERCVGWPV